jgi:hypothetical protein
MNVQNQTSVPTTAGYEVEELELSLVPKEIAYIPVNNLPTKPVYEWNAQFAA